MSPRAPAAKSSQRPSIEADYGALPLLSVVVPVYNQAASIVANVAVIRERVAAGLGEPAEILVVSDGSIDDTHERLLTSTDDANTRILHYDRNLGKGYAVKMGALAARGRWIAFVDADLDLDPAMIPPFLRTAATHGLDFAIGSKRHPESVVYYPRTRRAASWCYQQLVRLLFRLNVRDTQVGLKVFRREVAERVLPLLLVKRYAFDLELLAVSRALGFGRIRELPIVLEYRFSGSGVRSTAVLRALIDTAAIFYRLRVLRYYQRKKALLDGGLYDRSPEHLPSVSVIADNAETLSSSDYPILEVLGPLPESPEAGRMLLESARGSVIAILGKEAQPASNWLSAAVPFLVDPDISAVVSPTMSPGTGPVPRRAAAAALESRVGCGSLRHLFTPGNLQFVSHFPGQNIVARKSDLIGAHEERDRWDRPVERLVERGKLVLYTPETVVVTQHAPLLWPHLRAVFRLADGQARTARRLGLRTLRGSALATASAAPVLIACLVLASTGGAARLAGFAGLSAYGVVTALHALTASIRFRSGAVGVAALAALLPTQVAYTVGFLRGLLRAP